MHSPNRKNLYGELGISEAASPEEIRSAYLRLAKESHPDLAQTDQERIDAVEKMTRLNQAAEILAVEGKRAEYDREAALTRQMGDVDYRKALAALTLTRVHGKRRREWLVWVTCMAAGCLVVVGLAVLLSRQDREDEWWQARVLREGVRKTSETLLRTPPPAEPTASPDSLETRGVLGSDGARRIDGDSLPPLRRILPPVESAISFRAVPGYETPTGVLRPYVEPQVESQIAVRKAPAPAPIANAPLPSSAPPVGSASPDPPAPPLVTRAVPASPTPEETSGWNGIWRYRSASGGGVGGTFNPVSIEMRVASQGPKLRGLYRARYEATGKYLSEVAFLFEAQDNRGARVRGLWFGNNGEKGEFELTKLSPKEVQMSWWTTAFGKKKTLASGVARLGEGL